MVDGNEKAVYGSSAASRCPSQPRGSFLQEPRFLQKRLRPAVYQTAGRNSLEKGVNTLDARKFIFRAVSLLATL